MSHSKMSHSKMPSTQPSPHQSASRFLKPVSYRAACSIDDLMRTGQARLRRLATLAPNAVMLAVVTAAALTLHQPGQTTGTTLPLQDFKTACRSAAQKATARPDITLQGVTLATDGLPAQIAFTAQSPAGLQLRPLRGRCLHGSRGVVAVP